MIYKVVNHKIVKSYRFIKNAARHNKLSVWGVSAYCRGLIIPQDENEVWFNTDYPKENINPMLDLRYYQPNKDLL